jgi:hypothetical protein
MRTITYNDEALPWSRSTCLMGTRSLLSSDDSDNFSRTPRRTRAEKMTNQITVCLGLLNCTYLSPPAPIFPLFKHIAYVYSDSGLQCWPLLFLQCAGLCNKSFLCRHHYSSFYLMHGGDWPDRTCGIPGVGPVTCNFSYNDLPSVPSAGSHRTTCLTSGRTVREVVYAEECPPPQKLLGAGGVA